MGATTQVRTALRATARDLGAKGRDIYTGFGMVQARAAYDYLGRNPCKAYPRRPPPPRKRK